jgi:quercetin dioxygenase-like cupin family protein
MNKNTIIETAIKGLNVSKIFKTESTETLLVSLEKGATFPTHTSPKDALLVVLEGSINFFIEEHNILLETQQVYTFTKEVAHYVTANENTKFLIIR